MHHVIVGSGPAGCALASSLLEHCNDPEQRLRVTLLEAGDEPPPNARTGACGAPQGRHAMSSCARHTTRTPARLTFSAGASLQRMVSRRC
jgi:2-polyprenyl-6-methoxyphenol hydroxylase-like FAD-dependent oxidoreductase